MATPRKTSARSRKAKRPVRKAGTRAARAHAKASRARARSTRSSAARARRAPPKRTAARGASSGASKAKAAARKGAKSAVTARRGAAAAAPAPVVRPLGMIPPGSLARFSGRSGGATRSRPAVLKAPAPAPKTLPAPPDTQGDQRVTEADMKEFEEQLLAERQKIMKEMGHLETTVLKVNPRDSAGDLSGYSFHMADAGTDAMEREKAFLFASAEGRLLLEMNEALRRLYRGEYGICESCGRPIARARLEAMPHARLCVSCKEKEERAGRGAQ